ncbi:3,4-dihydroxy-2-butanone-4-phosphate synthase, partial [Staphylococcus epidermidis]|uniref:3,4-dihydroxy-2-butanone-4-phosphate synthase n=1 Tax=Staphylococcus epidermidis TaxID=1282 RepID=UPI0016432398
MDDNTINFMGREGGGVICGGIDKCIGERLKVECMEENKSDIYGRDFSVRIDDYKSSRGMSGDEGRERGRGVIDENSNREDFDRLGELF